MRFKDKLELARRMMKAAGVRDSDAAPALFRLLWRIGVRVPPPIMGSGWVNTLVFAVFVFTIFFVGYSLGNYVLSREESFLSSALESAGMGFLLGVFLSVRYFRLRVKYKLDTWGDLEMGDWTDAVVSHDDPA